MQPLTVATVAIPPSQPWQQTPSSPPVCYPSLSEIPSRMQSLSLPLQGRLKALTDAGGEQEGEGSYLVVSTEAVGKRGQLQH